MIVPVARTAGADVAVRPSMTVAEEFFDNIYLDHDEKMHEFITHIAPALHAEYEAPRWDGKIDYAYDHRIYGRGARDDDDAQKLELRGTVRFLRDVLALHVRDDYDRISTSVIRDFTQESPVTNVTEYNILELKPQTVLRPTSSATVTAGFRWRDVRYRDPVAIDRTVESLYGAGEWSGSRAGLDLSAQQERLRSEGTDRSRSELLAGPLYRYGDRFRLRLLAGGAASRADGGERRTLPVWKGSLDYQGQILSLHLETGRSWVEDPYRLELREDRYAGVLRGGNDRTSAGIGIARRDYGVYRETTERKHTVTADMRYGRPGRREGSCAVTADRYDLLVGDVRVSRTTVYGAEAGLDHYGPDGFTVSFRYRYTTSRSLDVPLSDYDANRVLFEVKKDF